MGDEGSSECLCIACGKRVLSWERIMVEYERREFEYHYLCRSHRRGGPVSGKLGNRAAMFRARL